MCEFKDFSAIWILREINFKKKFRFLVRKADFT